MHTVLSPVLSFVVILALAGCGDSGFTGSSGKSGNIDKPVPAAGGAAKDETNKSANATPASRGEATQKSDDTRNPDVTADKGADKPPQSNLVDASKILPDLGPNAGAIGTCLANLGITQLPPDAAQNFQELGADEMSPFANESVTDPDQKTKPGEVYIRLVHMHGFGPVVNFDMNLLNSQGIYCVETDSFSVFTSSKITMCKTGKVASTVANHTNLFDSGNVLKVGCD